MLDMVKLAVRNLSRRRTRTLLTVLSIAIGVLSVVLIMAVSNGGKAAFNKELSSMGVGGIMVGRDAFSEQTALGSETELEVIKGLQGVDNAIPVVVQYSKLALRNMLAETIVWGIDSGAEQVISMEVLHGRTFRQSDMDSKAAVCIIDEALAQKIYQRSNIVGKSLELSIQGRYETFEIIGVVASGGSLLQNVLSGYIPYFVYVPISTLQQYGGKSNFDQIAVQIEQGYDVDEQGEFVVSVLNTLNQSEVYRYENIATQKDNLNRLLDIVSLILTVIAGISLVVAGFGILTIMLVSVSERTKEIGIKKSLGASRAMIRREFLAESFMISLTGGVLGLATGVGAAWLAMRLIGAELLLAPAELAGLLFFVVTVGILCGVYPAAQAAKLRPVDALRQE